MISRRLLAISLATLTFMAFLNSSAQNDTLFADTIKNKRIIAWNHQYHQTLTMKLMLSQSHFDGKYKRRDNGSYTDFLTFEETLSVIQKIDRITLGIPKIIYLVGWQYNGHDSKYPAWFEVKESLKRKEDKTALESMIWLVKEAKTYNTTISVHINMFDAYDDSPLWETYVANDIIGKDKNGELIIGEWGHPISYSQEWKTGFAQRRIDSLLALLPIADAGTIHIDAFHTWPPIGKNGPGKAPFVRGPISPYLGYSVEEESQAQKEILKYWAVKGVDVTSEGATFLRSDSFDGYQPCAWWVDWPVKKYMEWPASYYTGGTERRPTGKLFGTSMHGEDIVKRDKIGLTGFKKEFCTSTVVWYYLNRLNREYLILNKNSMQAHFAESVVTKLYDNNFTLRQKSNLMVENNDLLMPALWMPEDHMIAYSENGYELKAWSLPENFRNIEAAQIWEVTLEGLVEQPKIMVIDGKIKLTLSPDQMLLIKPVRL